MWPFVAQVLDADPRMQWQGLQVLSGLLLRHSNPHTSWITSLLIKFYHYYLIMVCTMANPGYISYSWSYRFLFPTKVPFSDLSE